MMASMAARGAAPGAGACGRCRGFAPALGRRAADGALSLRGPARSLCGSLRAAVISLAAALAVLLLSEATYLGSKWNGWRRNGYEIIIAVDILVAASNVALIFGTLTAKLTYLYAWMSMGLVDLLVAVVALVWLPCSLGSNEPFVFMFPLSHFLCQLVLLSLVHGHAHELRGGRSPDYGGGGRGADGWLQLNLAHEAPPPPGLPSTKPFSPAVLEPSACTTASTPSPGAAPLSSQC